MIKKTIRNKTPQRIIYMYDLVKIFPKYIKSKLKAKKKMNNENISFWSDEETINMIINENKSLARFGDGELMWMSGENLKSFQDYSEKFSKDLITAFQNNNSNLLIGIPYGIINSKGCKLYAKMHWKIIRNDFLIRLTKFVDKDRKYCNASITRPYIDYKSRKKSKACFDNIKKIWDKRDLIIVEGEKTKLGVGNDLFSNAKSIKRIICPSTNAYDKISNIKRSIQKYSSKDDLIICALGPTASILASEMCNKGYQIVDIGHIDVEYMWYLQKAIIRKPIPGKHVNESGIMDNSSYYDYDIEYQKSITDKIL